MTHRVLSFIAMALLGVMSAVAPATAQNPSAAMGAQELPEPITLTENDITSLIRVGKELKALGVQIDSSPNSTSLGNQLAGRQQALDILERAKFTPERLQRVAYSVGLAMAAANQDFEQAREQLAEMQKMKDSMPAEQWAQMQAMMGPSIKMMEQAANQPKSNVALARKYEAELMALGE